MPRLAFRHLPILLAAAALLLSGDLAAQEVRGKVVERGSADPITGALVELLSATDSTVDRTVTGPAGNYALSARGAGTYRLRVERIGYEQWTSDALELEAGATLSLRADVPVQAIRLSDLDVSASRRCRTGPSESRRTARIWDETRKALESVRFTGQRGLLRFRIREYRQRADQQMDIVEESSQTYMAVGRHPFESLSASDLSDEGYVRSVEVDGKTLTDYFAPDAEALLSTEFLADHCFRMAGREDGMIGLAFRPVQGRKTPDISGTFWLDPHTAQLRLLTYRYANVELPSHEHRVGGRVEFVRLPEGSLVVRRWWIRMPRMGRTSLRLESYVRYGEEAVTGYDVVGGEVLEVYGPRGDTLRTAETAALVGTVRREGTDEPVAGATVRLLGTDRSSGTDGAGYFRLDLLTGGRYDLAVRDSLMTAAGLAPRVREVELETGISREIEVELPDRGTVHDRMCPEEAPAPAAEGHPRTAAVAGFVRDTAGRPVPGAVVEAAWEKLRARNLGRTERPSGNRVERERAVRRVAADDRGAYRLCHLPASWTLRLDARRDSAGESGRVREVQVGEGTLQRLDLEAPSPEGPSGEADPPARRGEGTGGS